jgi:hypothetical protein
MRGLAASDMKQIVEAMAYSDRTGGGPPTDILDARGKPLLSWRVRLLPYLEHELLYERFRLDEPWDSPHNKALIAARPKCYRDPRDNNPEHTRYLQPRGEKAFSWGRDGLHVLGAFGPKIVLVEADDEHAVIWTKPGDLPYDPANPTAGLAMRWHYAGLPAGTCLVGLVKNRSPCSERFPGTVVLVPENISPDYVRPLFEPDVPTASWPHAWREALFRRPWMDLALPSFLLSLLAVGGGAVIVWRSVRGKTLSPGEWLWLVFAGNQAVYLVCLQFFFDAEVVFYRPKWSVVLALWFLPAAGGTIVALMAWSRASAGWWAAFGANALLWASVVVLDSVFAPPYRGPEESFVTATAPFVLAGVSVPMMIRTYFFRWGPVREQRSTWHWAGLVVCLLPLVWFVFCWSNGVVEPRWLFDTTIIRD